MSKPAREDRIFVRNGRRHFRRGYSRTELRIGILIAAALILIVAWVGWKGVHPDPELLAALPELEETQTVVERGPVPEGLALAGWTEGSLSQFDGSNLYEKINGREGFYKSFGFQRLYFVSLLNDEDPAIAVDIEMFDLGKSENALGAYSGERSPGITPEVTDDGMHHFDRNAFFMTRGQHYIRAIGSEESPVILDQLNHLKGIFGAELAGEALPWAYGLFVGQLGMDPGKINYMAEDAFSFAFARDVYAALLDDEETEIFVISVENPDRAAELVAQFTEGFLSYGSPSEETFGVKWTVDRFIGSVSGVSQEGKWVLGVRGAPDQGKAEQAFQELAAAVKRLS